MVKITDQEFEDRILGIQKKMKENELDLLLCYGNEGEPQYIRYYSDYSPLFESGGVLIPVEGEPILLIGPESETFALEFSRIKKIRKILFFRESSDPEYPDAIVDTFEDVFKEVMNGRPVNKFGIAGASLVTQIVYSQLVKALSYFGDVEVLRADDLVDKQKVIKSVDEIACMQKSYDIVEYGLEKVVQSIRVGMTENQVKGIALAAIFEKGAESEGYPFWILTGKGSNKAIGRCRGKKIQAGDIVQIQISARYEGYVSTIGRAMVAGKATKEQRDLINAGLAVERAILDIAKPGLQAKEISEIHRSTLKELGFEDHILYGPCHGTGLMENEYPWIESTSDYLLEPNMTFCTCLYLGNDKEEIGIRIENGFRITTDKVELFSDSYREIIEF